MFKMISKVSSYKKKKNSLPIEGRQDSIVSGENVGHPCERVFSVFYFFSRFFLYFVSFREASSAIRSFYFYFLFLKCRQ